MPGTLSTDDFAAADRQSLRRLVSLGATFKVFYDVGASNGAWTRHICDDFPEAEFHMFEPLADHGPGFRQRIEETLNAPRFRLHKVALGAKNGHTRLYLMGKDLAGSSALETADWTGSAPSVEAEMTTIDHLVENGLPVPEVIKIDTQGFEARILEGAARTLPNVQVLFLESWLVRAYGKETPLLHELMTQLRPFGFFPWEFGDPWRNKQGVLMAQDVVFLNASNKASLLQNEPRLTREPAGLQPAARNWKEKAQHLLGRFKPSPQTTAEAAPHD